MTKFTVSYGIKTPTATAYEMESVNVTIESDTRTETMQNAFNRAKSFVETQISNSRR